MDKSSNNIIQKTKQKEILGWLVSQIQNKNPECFKNQTNSDSSIYSSSSDSTEYEYEQSSSEEDTGLFSFLFKKSTNTKTYLEEDNQKYSAFHSEVCLIKSESESQSESEMDLNSESVMQSDTVFNLETEQIRNFLKPAEINHNNQQTKLIEDIQMSLSCLSEKMDKIVERNHKLIEFTEIFQESKEDTPNSADTIQLWNRIENKNNRKNMKHRQLISSDESRSDKSRSDESRSDKSRSDESRSDKSNLWDSYNPTRKDTVFIVNEKSSTSEAYGNNNSTTPIINEDNDVVNRYIVKENSEDNAYQDNILEFYFPKYNQIKRN
jgi:hypothetical protein